MNNLNKVHEQLGNLKNMAQECGKEVKDPKGQALCETTYEVLAGLEKAYDHYLNKSEEAWK